MNGIIEQVSISAGGVPNRAIEQGELTSQGFAGDGWRHPQFHGTRNRAVLLITSEGLKEIQSSGFAVYPGALGENLTTLGLDRRVMRPGQRFRCGTATIELTEVRFPCETISVFGKGIQDAIYDIRVLQGDTSSELWGLSGFYAAVIQHGIVSPGDSISLAP